MEYVISVREDTRKTSRGSYSLLREILGLGDLRVGVKKYYRKKIYTFNYFMLTSNKFSNIILKPIF